MLYANIAIENDVKKSSLGDLLGRWWLLIFTLLLLTVFGILQSSFLNPQNLLAIFRNACMIAIAGCGLTCVMATGEIDFSTSSAMSLAACCMTILLDSRILDSYVLAVIIGLLAAAVLGFFNAFLHLVIGIPAFLATLSSSLIAKGLALVIIGGTTINRGIWNSAVYTFLGQYYLFGVIPMPFIVLLFVGIMIMFIMERTKVGYCLFAVGANQTACGYIGINVKKYKLIAFLLCAFLCGVSGIVQSSISNGAGPYMADSFMLLTMMVTVMGSTFLKKGVYNIPGTLLAAIFVSMVSNGMIMLEAATWAKMLIEGIMFIGAVIIMILMRKRTERI